MPKDAFYKPKIMPPKIDDNYELFDIEKLFQSDFEDINGKKFEKCERENEKIGSGNIDVCVFTNVRLIGCETYFSNFTDVVFESCDFSNTCFLKTSFHKVVFKNCKLTGASFNKTMLSNTLFTNCIGQLTSFNDCKFKQALFENNELVKASFFECLIKDFQFFNNNLNSIEIVRTSFKGVNFADSKIDGARLNLDSLKGAKVSKLQALSIISIFGLEVE